MYKASNIIRRLRHVSHPQLYRIPSKITRHDELLLAMHTVPVRDFHAPTSLCLRTRGRGSDSKRRRRRRREKEKKKKEEEGSIAEWGLHPENPFMASEAPRKEGVKVPLSFRLEREYEMPKEIQDSIDSDETYFHGRNGLASIWSIPSRRSETSESD